MSTRIVLGSDHLYIGRVVNTNRRNMQTPPSKPTEAPAQIVTYKSLMHEMAEIFPKLSQNVQEQARQAQGHVQLLIKQGLTDQAIGLMTHMKDMMISLTNPGNVPLTAPPFSAPVDNNVAIPPLPSSASPELQQVQRSLEDLQMRMQENSAVNLIARRVRDMDMEQKYHQLQEKLGGLKALVHDRLGAIESLTESASSLTRREVRKRTVSKNPFCEHEASGFCEFCVGRDADEMFISTANRGYNMSPSPRISDLVKEESVNQEMVAQMQQTLKSYQSTLKDLLEDRKRELAAARAAGYQS